MTNQMQDITDLINTAAAQNDRWMFVALLVLAIAGSIFFWRWLTNDREKLSTRLTEITDRHIESQAKLSEVVANNTAALHEVQATMRDVSSTIQHCKRNVV
jgi:hypothetical protein